MATSLGVESQPEAPSGKPAVCLGIDRISIAWCGSAYDGGCIIDKYMYVKIVKNLIHITLINIIILIKC